MTTGSSEESNAFKEPAFPPKVPPPNSSLNIIPPLISISPLKCSNQLHAFYGAWGFTSGGFKKKERESIRFNTTDTQKSHFTDAFRTIKPHTAQHYSTG